MNNKNSCFTYFRIVGNFNPDDVTRILEIIPEKSSKIGDLGSNGKPYSSACWETGRCMEYDVFVDNQMKKTIALLQNKISLLNQIKNEYDVSFFLEVVPMIYTDESTPCLAPSLEIIDFCHATRTEIDIDMYVYDHNDE